ncbi:MAG: hypothetical protein ACRET8_01230 [Burkholderiales bacterium]
MKAHFACFASLLLISLAMSAPIAAQTAKPGAKESARERAIKRCKANRGIDCESKEGLREYLGEDRPITDEEQRAAAGARRHREACAKNPRGSGC